MKSLTTAVPYFLHWTNNMGVLISGKVIFNTNHIPQDFGHLALGLLAHLGFGGVMAIGLSLIYQVAGTDFYLTKGALFGVFVWLFIRSILISVGMPGEPKELSVLTAMVSMISHLLYGVVTGYIIVKFNRFLRPHNQQ